MATITKEAFSEIMKSIKEHQAQNEKITKAVNAITESKVMVAAGGKILDSLIELLRMTFNDTGNIIEWYIFENEHGKNDLSKNIGGEEIKIGNADRLMEVLVS